MRKGFTIVELIFVIVILGILAAVAIPRLNATRDDAEISKGASNLATVIMDITTYYTSKGEFKPSTTWDDVTNLKLLVDSRGLNITENTLLSDDVFLSVKHKNCLKISILDSGILVSNSGISNDPICISFNQISSIKDLTKIHTFGGKSVKLDP